MAVVAVITIANIEYLIYERYYTIHLLYQQILRIIYEVIAISTPIL